MSRIHHLGTMHACMQKLLSESIQYFLINFSLDQSAVKLTIVTAAAVVKGSHKWHVVRRTKGQKKTHFFNNLTQKLYVTFTFALLQYFSRFLSESIWK